MIKILILIFIMSFILYIINVLINTIPESIKEKKIKKEQEKTFENEKKIFLKEQEKKFEEYKTNIEKEVKLFKEQVEIEFNEKRENLNLKVNYTNEILLLEIKLFLNINLTLDEKNKINNFFNYLIETSIKVEEIFGLDSSDGFEIKNLITKSLPNRIQNFIELTNEIKEERKSIFFQDLNKSLLFLKKINNTIDVKKVFNDDRESKYFDIKYGDSSI